MTNGNDRKSRPVGAKADKRPLNLALNRMADALRSAGAELSRSEVMRVAAQAMGLRDDNELAALAAAGHLTPEPVEALGPVATRDGGTLVAGRDGSGRRFAVEPTLAAASRYLVAPWGDIIDASALAGEAAAPGPGHRYHRTRVSFEILSEEAIGPDEDVAAIVEEATSGSYVMGAVTTSSHLVDVAGARATAIEFGSTPDFLDVSWPSLSADETDGDEADEGGDEPARRDPAEATRQVPGRSRRAGQEETLPTANLDVDAVLDRKRTFCAEGIGPTTAAGLRLVAALAPFAHYARVADPSDMDPLLAIATSDWVEVAAAYAAMQEVAGDSVRAAARPFADAVLARGGDGPVRIRVANVVPADWETVREVADRLRGAPVETARQGGTWARYGRGFAVTLMTAIPEGRDAPVLRFTITPEPGVEAAYGKLTYDTLVGDYELEDVRQRLLDAVEAAVGACLRADPHGEGLERHLAVLSWLETRHLTQKLVNALRVEWDVVGTVFGPDAGPRIVARAALPLSLRVATSSTWVVLIGGGEAVRWDEFDTKREAKRLVAEWTRLPPARVGSLVR